jgi:hypothetical protein
LERARKIIALIEEDPSSGLPPNSARALVENLQAAREVCVLRTLKCVKIIRARSPREAYWNRVGKPEKRVSPLFYPAQKPSLASEDRAVRFTASSL